MLSGKQRAYLRSIGTNLDAIFQLGKNGIEEGFLNQIEEALEAKEIIKVNVLRNSEYDAREACDEICCRIGAEPIQVIGNKFVIYKKSKKNPRIQLPR